MRALFILLATEFLIVSSATASEKPFSFKDTPGKLPKEVVPTDYSVRIVPDINKFTFAGTETVKLNVRSAVRQLVLNALELKIETASINGKDLPVSAIKTDTKNELLTLALPSELATGEHTLTLRFTGKINEQGQGLFYMRYQEHGNGARKIMLGTQFEATDARRFFPCWDEPAFRARFQLTAVCTRKLARCLKHADPGREKNPWRQRGAIRCDSAYVQLSERFRRGRTRFHRIAKWTY